MKLNEAIELLDISEDNVPYFLEWWEDYPVLDYISINGLRLDELEKENK